MACLEQPPLLLARHDPNAGLQGLYTIEIPLDDGEALVGPVTVIAVTPDWTDAPLVETSNALVISSISVAQLTASPNVWGVSFNMQFGNPQTYWLLVAAFRNTTPQYGVNRTVRFICRNN